MRTHTALFTSLTVAALSAAGGQVTVTPRAGGTMTRSLMPSMAMREGPRAVMGVTTSSSTSPRDTLGLLVSTVTHNSPAEKAGIEDGNRIASINGVSLKLAASDIGDDDMQGLMSRRLVRELDKVKPGDEVDLRVYGGGQLRTIKVKTVDPDSLYSTARYAVRAGDDHPTLGVGIGSSGSKRDTLGVFVMSVIDVGPAAKAGIEEGQRIAAINGVDLRVGREDAGDGIVSRARVNRLEREMAKVKSGDVVDLRVYANGQTRVVKVTTVAASSLPNNLHNMMITSPGAMPDVIIRRRNPPDGMDLDGEIIGTTVRRALERAQAVSGERIEDVGRMLDNLGRSLNGGGSVRWFDDDAPMATPAAKVKPTTLQPRKTSTTISM